MSGVGAGFGQENLSMKEVMLIAAAYKDGAGLLETCSILFLACPHFDKCGQTVFDEVPEAVELSHHLRKDATKKCQECLAFWLRGLPP